MLILFFTPYLPLPLINCQYTRNEQHHPENSSPWLLTTRSEYDRLGRLHRRDVFTGNAQRPSPRRWSRRWDYDYRNNLVREERDDNPFSWYRWQYDSAGRLLVQDGTLPGQEQWRWDAAGNPLEGSAEKVTHNRLTQLNGIRWRYDIHGRTVEKDNGQTRWHYRYDGEHRLTEVISQPRDRNRPQTQVSFRYDPLGRRISKTRRQMLFGQPTGKPVTTRFVWEGFRLLQEVHGDVPLTYVYSDQDSYDPLARIDGVDAPEIFWFHCQPNGTPERMTDSEGQVRWEGGNSAWGKLLRESETQVSGYSQNLRMQGQYLDRETGLHYNLFRYYDPDCGRFTQQDPIGLAGGINLYQYAPNALGWVDPWGLSRCKNDWNEFQKKSNKRQFSSRTQASKAYALWKKQDWAALEKFMGDGAWPPNRGFITATKTTLKPGTKVDRYGGWTDADGFHDSGTFISPAGSSFEGRALQQNTLNKPYSVYEVLKPLPVDSGPAIPWFGQPGRGTQYETSEAIEALIENGFLRKI